MKQSLPNNAGRTLKERAISGIGFSAFAQLSRQAVSLFTTAALAWFVSPSEFGLVGMAMVAVGFGQVFSTLGTGSAVIQRKDLTEELLSSVFWLNAFLGVVVATAMCLFAPAIASIFYEPRLIPIARALSVAFLLYGVSLTHQALLERELAFGELAKISLAAALSGSVAGIASAWLHCGAFSLVYQMLAIAGVETILLWRTSHWRPLFHFKWHEVQSVLNYSLNLSGYYLFEFLVKNADNLLIGRFFGARELGYYTLAFRLGFMPLQAFSTMIGRVMFPVYVKIQHDDEAFRRIYLRAVGLIAAIAFPFAFGMLAIADSLIHAVFGPTWHPTSILLMLLVAAGLCQCLGATANSIYLAKGRTDWLFRWGSLSGMSIALAFLLGLRWGTFGVAGCYAFVSLFILSYPTFAIPFRLINLDIPALSRALWPPFLSSTMMLTSILIIRQFLPVEIPELWSLGIQFFGGFIIYILSSWRFNRAPFKEARNAFGRFSTRSASNTPSLGG